MTATAAWREMILEKNRAGQLLAKAKGKHIGRPSGVNQDNYTKIRKALEKVVGLNPLLFSILPLFDGSARLYYLSQIVCPVW